MKIYTYNGKKNVIGPTVRQLREARGLKKTVFTKQIQLQGVKMNRNAVYQIEEQLRYVKDYEMRAIASVLDVNIKDLYPDDAEIFGSYESQKR